MLEFSDQRVPNDEWFENVQLGESTCFQMFNFRNLEASLVSMLNAGRLAISRNQMLNIRIITFPHTEYWTFRNLMVWNFWKETVESSFSKCYIPSNHGTKCRTFLLLKKFNASKSCFTMLNVGLFEIIICFLKFNASKTCLQMLNLGSFWKILFQNIFPTIQPESFGIISGVNVYFWVFIIITFPNAKC